MKTDKSSEREKDKVSYIMIGSNEQTETQARKYPTLFSSHGKTYLIIFTWVTVVSEILKPPWKHYMLRLLL